MNVVIKTFTKKELQIAGTVSVATEDVEENGRHAVSTPTLGYKTKVKWFLPKRYANPLTSGLKVKIEPGMEPVRLELTGDKQ